jgi:hypothetical protein
MSMNICIIAQRVISFKKKDGTRGEDIQTLTFGALQTPTKVTYGILESDSPIQAYTDWVLGNSEDQTIPIYAESDLFSDGPPVGVETYNVGKEHVERLLEWLSTVDEQGFTIKFEMA